MIQIGHCQGLKTRGEENFRDEKFDGKESVRVVALCYV